MQTLIDLLFGGTLTRLVFFPALACLPLLFFPKGSERTVKVYALRLPDRVRFRLAGPEELSQSGRSKSRAPGRGVLLAARLRHPLRPADGRHLDASRDARDLPAADRLPRLLEGDRQALAC